MGKIARSLQFTDSMLFGAPGSFVGPSPASAAVEDIFNDPDAWSIGSSDDASHPQLKPFTKLNTVHYESLDEGLRTIQSYPFLTIGEPSTKDDLSLDLKRLSVMFTSGSNGYRSVPSPISFPSPVTPAPSYAGRSDRSFTPMSLKTAFTVASSPATAISPSMVSASVSATYSILHLYGNHPETPKLPKTAGVAGSNKGKAESAQGFSIPPVPTILPPPVPPSAPFGQNSFLSMVKTPPTPPPQYTRDCPAVVIAPKRRPLPPVPVPSLAAAAPSTRSLPAVPTVHTSIARRRRSRSFTVQTSAMSTPIAPQHHHTRSLDLPRPSPFFAPQAF